MSFSNPHCPNLPDFIVYARQQGITPAALPDDSEWFVWALKQAEAVTLHFASIPSILYVIAVYNFGINWLINWAQDRSGLVISSLTWASGLVTVVTALPLGNNAGDAFGVLISGAVPVGYNGKFTATNAGASQFSYPLETNPGAATSTGVFAMTFFADARASFQLLSYTAGPVASSFDQGTGQSLVVPEWLQSATLATQGLLKTPWGRAYLEYTQAWGPNVVGVS